ncbi:MAG TPA: FeoB-associated Cys-rich membrane protein [Candidatus Didemnitutus sp.]|nr:FeoB-associated Cys-rich membrane protein [Candidatus Didemnitutus sp.]
MSSTIQTVVALAIVAIAVAWLVWSALRKRKQPGCGDSCGAVSPEVKRLQAHLKR